MLSLNNLYARFTFRLDTDKRMNLYLKIASLLRNDFTLMNALERCGQIESKNGIKKDEPFAIVIKAWQKNLEKGMTFADAVHNWVPQNEILMLSVGDVTKLSLALENLVKASIGVSKIKKSLFDALAYPSFLFLITFIIIIMVGLYLVPPLSEVGGGNIVWRGTAASLIAIAKFSKYYWLHAVLVLVSIVLFMWWSLANMTSRVRVLFDKLPPWNMYKVSTSVSWMMSLAAIVSSGSTLSDALKMLSNSGTPYLRRTLEPVQRFIENGDNLGTALRNTGRHFPNDEIIGDLEVYADMNEFDKNLMQIANDFMESSDRRVKNLSSVLNSVGILLVSFVIAWVVFGTFDMQEQITAALS